MERPRRSGSTGYRRQDAQSSPKSASGGSQTAGWKRHPSGSLNTARSAQGVCITSSWVLGVPHEICRRTGGRYARKCTSGTIDEVRKRVCGSGAQTADLRETYVRCRIRPLAYHFAACCCAQVIVATAQLPVYHMGRASTDCAPIEDGKRCERSGWMTAPKEGRRAQS